MIIINNFNLLNLKNKDLYQQFCKSTINLPVFVQYWYLDAVCENGTWDVALVEENNQVLAAMPYFLKQKGPFKYIAMPMFVKHMGVYFSDAVKNLAQQMPLMEKILAQLPDVDCLKQDFHPSLKNWLPFYWNDYQESTRYTYQICQLQDLDKTYAGFNRNIKRNIKKAKAVVRVVSDLSPTTFYQINEKSFARQGMKMPYSLDQFLKLDKILAEQQSRQMFFAIDENEHIHAVSYLIWDQQSSYYHLSGDNPDFRKSGATILLIWEAIQYTQQVLDLNTFDFAGSMVKRIEVVRRQFGAVQQPYFRIWKYNSFWYKILDKFILKN